MSESPKAAAHRLAAPAFADGYKSEALHVYTDASGHPLYWRIRAKHPHTGEKWIRPMHMNGAGYVLGEPPFSAGKPLYRLDRLAARPEDEVLLVEGEWCSDRLAKLGLLATTSGAADSVTAADLAPLKGRTVVIWPDNDDAGRRFASEAVTRLLGLGCAVSQIDVDSLDLPAKGDAVDWLNAHPDADANEVGQLPRVEATPGSPAKRVDDDARDVDERPEPQPLPDGLPPVAAFDSKLIPEPLRSWADDLSERMQCAPDFVGVTIMTALGSLIGRKVAIRPQARTDWTEVPNQWAMLIGRPGVLKSPAMEAALGPLKRLSAKAAEDFELRQADYELERKIADLAESAAEQVARKKLKGNPRADVRELLTSERPEGPVMRRYDTTSSTVEALAELLRFNPNGVLVYRDELVSLLKSLDREDNAEARGFYLTGWGGQSQHITDRIGRGLNLRTPAVCLSVLGSTQPARISEYVRAAVRGTSGDDGLIQRFGLMVWPDTSGTWRNVDRWPDSPARDAAWQTFSRLDQIDALSVGAEQDADPEGEPTGVPYLRYDPEALEAFVEWRTQLEALLRGDLLPALESHFAKYRKLVPTLALICHLADFGQGPIGIRPMVQALAWVEYLETHALRVYGAATSGEVEAANAIVAKIRSGKLEREFSSRDVWRPNWSGLTERPIVLDALQLLVDHHWIGTREELTQGRPATVYVANPRAFPL